MQWSGARWKFVGGHGREVRIAATPKDTKMVVRGACIEEDVVRGFKLEGFCWMKVEEESGGVRCLYRICRGRGHASLEKKTTDYIVCGTNNALSPSVPRRCVVTRHAQADFGGRCC